MMNKWSVVIPSNDAARLRQCVKALYDSHPDLSPARTIVIDDGARADWSEKDPDVTWIGGIKPFVFARAVNQGIVHADGDDIVIMGDDVKIMSYGAFDTLRYVTHDRPDAAIVSAGIDGPAANREQKRITRNAVRETKDCLSFICVYITRKWINKIGMLDESFTDYGGEDYDMNIRAANAGGRLMIADAVHAIHNDKGMESAFRSKPDIIELGARGHGAFRKKWKIES